MSNEVKVIPLGEPALPPLDYYQLSQIALGLLIPSQGASKAMARVLLRNGGLDDYGNPVK